jgi:hypothetical protein
VVHPGTLANAPPRRKAKARAKESSAFLKKSAQKTFVNLANGRSIGTG